MTPAKSTSHSTTRLVVLAVWSCVCAASVLAGERGPGAFRAAAAHVDITPPTGLPMWGYGGRRDLPSRGVRDPLEAAVVVLDFGPQSPGDGRPGPREAQNGRLALVGLDLGRSPARRTMETLRRRLREEAGVGHVFVVGSHTHHGPCLELEDTAPTAGWIGELVDKLVVTTREAAGKLRPARYAVGGKELELNRNRHSKLSRKPVDRRLIVLRVDGEDGKPIATVVNFAAHPTTLPSSLLEYSADYPGALKDRVEKDLGGTCVFLQGAAGDLSTDRRGKTTEEYGHSLAIEVAALWKELEPVAPKSPRLRVRREEFCFENPRVDLTEPLTRLKYNLAFFKSLVDAYIREYDMGVRPELQVAVIGDDKAPGGAIGIVGVSGEFFCSHALRLRKRARLRELLFLGYCNGYHQYFPTIEAVAEGGYGADPEVSPVEIGGGERMMRRALYLLYRLRGKLER